MNRLSPATLLSITCLTWILSGCMGGATGEGGSEGGNPDAGIVQECNGSRAIGARSLSDTAQNKIVGGLEANVNAWPWAAAIVTPSLFQFCGGSLIALDWVLTAAHCQVGNGDKVIIGRHNLTGSDGQVIDVDFVITHNDYNDATNNNDIALIKLKTPVTGTATLALIEKNNTLSEPGMDSTIIGWGKLSEGGSTSDTLQQVTVPIVDSTQCARDVGLTITSNMLCAGKEEGGKDSCQGDSGGPLMVKTGDNPQQWSQAGIVSFGIGCAQALKYGVYTRVSQYRDWVSACRANPPN